MENKEIMTGQMLTRICEISRLKLNEKESESIKKDCNSILSYFSQIQKISQDKVSNTNHVFGSNVSDLRKDEVNSFQNVTDIRSQFAYVGPNGLMKAPKNL